MVEGLTCFRVGISRKQKSTVQVIRPWIFYLVGWCYRRCHCEQTRWFYQKAEANYVEEKRLLPITPRSDIIVSVIASGAKQSCSSFFG